MTGVHDEAIARWRAARKARDGAWDRLVVAETNAGVRQPMSRRVTSLLVVSALLALLVAGLVWWRLPDMPAYSDRELVDAAVTRTEVLLTADADEPGRAREILAGATGEFRDSFAQSAEAYTRFVEQRGTRGTADIDAAALAARDGDRGVVLIAASLALAGGDAAAAGDPGASAGRPLRLRVVVEPADGLLKLSGVTFLP